MQQPTTTERVIAIVTTFEGYAKSFYCDYLGITRKQFDSVARRRLQQYGPQQSLSYVTWYLKDSAKYPQN
jgi:hypothetical protein